MTIKQLLDQWPHQLMGALAGRFPRFPLLLKFLDVSEALSVQVHPSDSDLALIPEGETGKTEAWIVLKAGVESRIYAGLKRGITGDQLRAAIANREVEDHLASFTPNSGDAILVQAGTVHSLNDVVVFEVQENSDVTFRLYDWDHIDPKTGQHRPLQVDQALACINFDRGPIEPIPPVIEEAAPLLREKLLVCEHFSVWRILGEAPCSVGVTGKPRVLVCLSGKAILDSGGHTYPLDKGDVVLLPAAIGPCTCEPEGAIHLLEIALPEGSRP